MDTSFFGHYWEKKQLIGGSHFEDDFVGRLKISGAYTLNKWGNIVGEKHSKFNKFNK